MTHGYSEIDIAAQRHGALPRPRDPARRTCRRAPARRSSRPTGSSTPPSSTSPTAACAGRRWPSRRRSSAPCFYETVGWERPWWYESNAGLVEKYGDAVMPREHEWDSRWWSPIINAEHLAMRENAGVIDLTAFCIFDITGPGALASVQQTCVAQCDVAVGKVIYTPVLDAKGGFLSDLTVMRLGEDHFRVVTGGAHGMADRKWFTDHLVDGRLAGRPHRGDLHDRPVGPTGPRHPRLAHRRRRDRRAASASSPAGRSTSRASTPPCWPRGSPTSASSAGSSTCRSRRPRSCGTPCSAPARTTARCRSASASTARPAASRRATAPSASSSTPSAPSSRPAMQRPKVKAADFVGKEAYLAQREQRPRHGAVHAHRRRPHLGQRHEALHARRRADPDPRRRHRSPTATATTPTSPRQARRRRWASTSCWPTCPRTRRASATSSRSPTWRSSTRSPSAPSTPRRCSTPPTSGSG